MSEDSVTAGAGVLTSIASGSAKGATKAVVKNFIENLVIPYFNGRKSKSKIISGIRRYARNLEFRTKCVPTIAIQGGTFFLDDVYEPLTLIGLTDNKSYKVDDYPSNIFSKHRCVVIVDSAGMGKSTLTKYIIRKCICDLRKIPILVELRRIKQGQGIVTFICDEILGADNNKSISADLSSSLADGNFIFLLDGYDEIDVAMRSQLSEEISRLSADFQYCNFWLTSRPDSALASFSQFYSFRIRQLEKQQAFSLLKRYDKNRGVADGLIQKIQNVGQVDDFLGNPLLVTLLYKAFDYKATVPIKKNLFFRQVFDALYQDHDLSKEGAFERRKKSNLDLDDFHKLMRYLGFLTFKDGKVQYSQAEFSSHVKMAIESSRLSVDASKVISDLVSAVPLFSKDGDELRWSHKAFQDYFSAQFVYTDSSGHRKKFIERLFSKEYIARSRNVLVMLGEMDINMIREICIYPFLLKMQILDWKKNKSDGDVMLDVLFHSLNIFVVKGVKENGKKYTPNEIFGLIRNGFENNFKYMPMRSASFRNIDFSIVVAIGNEYDKFSTLHEIDPALFVVSKYSIGSVKKASELFENGLTQVCRGDLDLNSVEAHHFLRVVSFVADIAVPSFSALKTIERDFIERDREKLIESIFDEL